MQKYSEQQKLEAVETYLSGDLGLRATAAFHNVNFSSLRKWVASFEAIGIAGSKTTAKERPCSAMVFQLQHSCPLIWAPRCLY